MSPLISIPSCPLTDSCSIYSRTDVGGNLGAAEGGEIWLGPTKPQKRFCPLPEYPLANLHFRRTSKLALTRLLPRPLNLSTVHAPPLNLTPPPISNSQLESSKSSGRGLFFRAGLVAETLIHPETGSNTDLRESSSSFYKVC